MIKERNSTGKRLYNKTEMACFKIQQQLITFLDYNEYSCLPPYNKLKFNRNKREEYNLNFFQHHSDRKLSIKKNDTFSDFKDSQDLTLKHITYTDFNSNNLYSNNSNNILKYNNNSEYSASNEYNAQNSNRSKISNLKEYFNDNKKELDHSTFEGKLTGILYDNPYHSNSNNVSQKFSPFRKIEKAKTTLENPKFSTLNEKQSNSFKTNLNFNGIKKVNEGLYPCNQIPIKDFNMKVLSKRVYK